MNFKEFPVVDILDFKAVTIDATQWSSTNYSLMFTFWKSLDRTVKDEPKAEGMILCTHMGGSNLREAYDNFEILFSSGFFNGISVFPNGVLWNDQGEILSEIHWQELEDYSEDKSEVEDFELINCHKSPIMLQ